MKPAHRVILAALLLFAAFAVGCSVEKKPSNQTYKYVSGYSGPVKAKNIEVMTARDGSYNIKGLTDDASLPTAVEMENNGSGGVTRTIIKYPDVLGSANVHVKIDGGVGYTSIAGLKFVQEATLNIWSDGVVEVDQEGIEALDREGNAWLSKKTTIGDKSAIVMVSKSLAKP